MTQCDRIARDLVRGKTITPLGALRNYGCMRLGARIYDLRRKGGMPILAKRITRNGKSFAGYYLETQQ